ncbi:GNAT family N-acetyltransferase [Hymenobacter cellulosilyticus]|uniref:GNAT family N-acetyltransferase n=1 Tax=Hymenobacter cellulosilyticus TaxID=2932248 RepID=A0A8T9QBU3_9BACT|nr:GNAT family N-acetyltransferase [Hymenobacter cellulosilyticus]UOQ74452.1 GNAT family N-acetyltransferase [Hymenobacter cellulosilyticus]
MRYREAQLSDIPQLMQVRLAVRENRLSDPARVPYEAYVDYLTRRGRGWVCEVENRIVGFAIVDVQDHSIWALFLLPDYEARGIGKTLHDQLLTWYFQQTQHPIWLSTTPAPAPKNSTAARAGKKPAGRRAGRYGSSGLNR